MKQTRFLHTFLLLLFQFLFFHGNAQNRQLIDSLARFADNAKVDTVKIEYWNAIADEYNASDSANTFLYARKALTLSREIKYGKGIVDAYYIMAWAVIRTGNLSYADELCARAYQVSDSVGYTRGKTKALNGLGVIQRRLGNYNKALQYQFESLEIEEEMDDKRGQSGTYNNIGFIYNQQGDYDASLAYFKRSLAIKLEEGYRKGLTQNYYNIGNIFYERGKYDSAHFFFEKAFEISKDENDIRSIASGYSNLGRVFFKTNQPIRALEYLLKALDLGFEMNNKGKIAYISISIAEVYAKLNDIDNAIRFAKQGIEYSREIRSPEILSSGYKLLSEVSYQDNDYKRAFDLRMQYEAINDSLRNDEKTQEMAIVEAEYEFQKEKNELELNRERELLAYELEIERRKIVQRATYAGIIFLVLLLILIYFNFRTKHNANKRLKRLNSEIHSQNIEIKSQRDHLQDTLIKLQKTQTHLLETEKMASLGILTTGVAHEINNPLNYIKGAYEALRKHFAEYPPPKNSVVPELLESINEGINRTSLIIQGLNEFGKDKPGKEEKCDIHSIIDNCLVMLNNKIMHRINVVKDYIAFDTHMTGNNGKLHQVFLNVLTNSVQAIEGSGTIEIRSYVKKGKIIISIKDSGNGISEENLPKISDPFFTTKEPGEGTGLGLSISYNIVQEHQGHIDIKSEEGTGTEVKVTLPLDQLHSNVAASAK